MSFFFFLSNTLTEEGRYGELLKQLRSELAEAHYLVQETLMLCSDHACFQCSTCCSEEFLHREMAQGKAMILSRLG